MKLHTSNPAPGQRGSITVEAALVMPVLVMVVAASMAMLGVVRHQQRCDDAARLTAQALSWGYSPSRAQQIGQRNAGSSATVTVNAGAALWRVNVEGSAAGWPWSWLGVRIPVRSQLQVPARPATGLPP